MFKKIKFLALAFFAQLTLSASVSAQLPSGVLTVTGTIDTSSGSIAALVSPGDPINATGEIAGEVLGQLAVTEDDVLDLVIIAGGLCLYADVADCPGGTITLPLVPNPNNPNSWVHPGTYVDLLNGGVAEIVDILLAQEVEITITFDPPTTDTTINNVREVTGTGTFVADGGADLPGETDLGGASGTITYSLSGELPDYVSVPMLPIALNIMLFVSLVFGWRKYKASVM